MSKTILVVDDDQLIRKTLGAALEAKGFTVETAANGREGLAKAKSGVDLIVADIRMPEMDGLQMVDALRKEPSGKDVPVIILSNDEQTASLNQALQAGVTVYLSKTNLDADAIADQIAGALA